MKTAFTLALAGFVATAALVTAPPKAEAKSLFKKIGGGIASFAKDVGKVATSPIVNPAYALNKGLVELGSKVATPKNLKAAAPMLVNPLYGQAKLGAQFYSKHLQARADNSWANNNRIGGVTYTDVGSPYPRHSRTRVRNH